LEAVSGPASVAAQKPFSPVGRKQLVHKELRFTDLAAHKQMFLCSGTGGTMRLSLFSLEDLKGTDLGSFLDSL
jgi:hypothetical protein